MTAEEVTAWFLFAVARWGQRNSRLDRRGQPAELFLFAVARWGQRNNDQRALVERGGFLFAVARWGQRNEKPPMIAEVLSDVSIRCREMGTAELCCSPAT